MFLMIELANIGSDNGLTPKRRQDIILTNDDPSYWRKYAPLDLNEITQRWHSRRMDYASRPIYDTLAQSLIGACVKWCK